MREKEVIQGQLEEAVRRAEAKALAASTVAQGRLFAAVAGLRTEIEGIQAMAG
jgi:hypothetical protein